NTEKFLTIRSKGGIDHVQGFAIAPGIITTNDDIEGILLKGIDSDFDWEKIERYIIRGQKISYDPTRPTEDLLISEETAGRLQLELGDRLIINFLKGKDQLRRRFSICGIYKTGLVEYDQRFALVDIRKVQNVLGWEETNIAGYEVFLDHIEDMDLINEYIYLDVLPTNLYSETIRSKFPAIFEWLELQNVNEDVILILMIIVAMLNMVTALIILILEHTNMIGALKAMGSRNWSIRKIFIYHASYIILWGLLIGNTIGIGFCILQSRFEWIKLDEKSYYLSVAPIELNVLSVLLTNLFTLLLIISFLIIPSYIVTRISPVRALHYQ
ncbi:MAG: FtsX-like permease family protein, partial [Melioribacteraceae bacterium]|nr:FtsX-like permease family protein [Melioribacteraceae bacterium]